MKLLKSAQDKLPLNEKIAAALTEFYRRARKGRAAGGPVDALAISFFVGRGDEDEEKVGEEVERMWLRGELTRYVRASDGTMAGYMLTGVPTTENYRELTVAEWTAGIVRDFFALVALAAEVKVVSDECGLTGAAS